MPPKSHEVRPRVTAQKSISAPAFPAPVHTSITLSDGTTHDLVIIQPKGDILLNVLFTDTSACRRSVLSEASTKFHAAKVDVLYTRVLFRVDWKALTDKSKYFSVLLGGNFGEGENIKKAFAEVAAKGLEPAELEASQLPQVEIEDDDEATRTMGREHVFGDMMRIIHNLAPIFRPISLTYLAVLIALADRFGFLCPPLTTLSTFVKFKYPVSGSEEVLRKTCLIYYYTNQFQRFAEVTRELIRRNAQWKVGSGEELSSAASTLWYDLPGGIESEILHRRSCILRTIQSVLVHFLSLYTSRKRQCRFGYDSSPACDSFQLGEMIKFLTRKALLSLVPFQAISPDDLDYFEPRTYDGSIDELIGTLRAWPEHQVDQNHKHCGPRVTIMPILKYIQHGFETNAAIQLKNWKVDRARESWVKRASRSEISKPAFMVGNESIDDIKNTFNYPSEHQRDQVHAGNSAVSAKAMFVARKWIWTSEKEEQSTLLKPSGLAFKF